MSEQSPSKAKRTKRTATPPAPEAAKPVTKASEPVEPAAPEKRKTTRSKVNGAASLSAASTGEAGAVTAAKAPKKAATTKRDKVASPKPAAKAKAAAPAAKKAAVSRLGAKAPAARPTAPEAAVAVAGTAQPLSIVLVASEVAPLTGASDIGDVVGGAAARLGALGHRVTVIVPKYSGMATPGPAVDRFAVSLGAHDEEVACHEVSLGQNARIVLLEHPGFFDREFHYGQGQEDYADNPRRFAFLARAALEFLAREGERVDIVQAFDWQTGLLPVYLAGGYRQQPALANARVVFTIHNVAFQGLCSPDWLFMLGLAPELFQTDGLEYWGRISFLKGGVRFADLVTTLSDEYHSRLLTPGRGAGFEGVLASRGTAFRAVLSGEVSTGPVEPQRLAEGLAALYSEALGTAVSA